MKEYQDFEPRRDVKLPSPETDMTPQLTRFILDIGFFYGRSIDNDFRYNNKMRNKLLNKIASYLSDSFIEVLKRELNIVPEKDGSKK